MGDFAEQETIISENSSSMKVHKATGALNEIVQGIFQAEAPRFVYEVTSLCPSIELYLKMISLSFFATRWRNLGEIKLVLAPVKNKA
jgi:predicted choloylglycine hydrolase